MMRRAIKSDEANLACLAATPIMMPADGKLAIQILDNHGRKTGHSESGFFGSYNHYDASGKPSGSSDPGLFGGYSNNSTQGCYVATCVYGSYDCPEVWTLRRFRDFFLAEHLLGRWFIRCYYTISPTIVRLVGKKAWFQGFWRTRLDRLVSRLWSRGYDHTPYQDREW